MAGATGARGTVFEALWAPRWFGQDQAVAHGQEGDFEFRAAVPPVAVGFIVMAAGLDRPRYRAPCRVLGLKHDVLGRLQAIAVIDGKYHFVRHDGDVIVVDGQGGGVCHGLQKPPADWTVRIVFEAI